MSNATTEPMMTDVEIVENYGFTSMNQIRKLYYIRDALPMMAELVKLGIESVEATAEGRPLRQEVIDMLTGEGGNALFQLMEGFDNSVIGPEDYQQPSGDSQQDAVETLTRDEQGYIATFRQLPEWKRILVTLSLRVPRPLGRVIVRGLLLVTSKPT